MNMMNMEEIDSAMKMEKVEEKLTRISVIFKERMIHKKWRPWKQSAWADPPSRPPPPPIPKSRRQPRTGDLVLKSTLQCNACANIIAQDSILRCRDMTFPLHKDYPVMHYVNCPNCSAEMVIEIVESKPGFKYLLGASEYAGPVAEVLKMTYSGACVECYRNSRQGS